LWSYAPVYPSYGALWPTVMLRSIPATGLFDLQLCTGLSQLRGSLTYSYAPVSSQLFDLHFELLLFICSCYWEVMRKHSMILILINWTCLRDLIIETDDEMPFDEFFMIMPCKVNIYTFRIIKYAIWKYLNMSNIFYN